jgi:hypothetical protein
MNETSLRKGFSQKAQRSLSLCSLQVIFDINHYKLGAEQTAAFESSL